MEVQPACAALRVAYFFTRFPHVTESFLQREVRAMRRLGLEPELFSLHRGGCEFEGLRVQRFSKWALLRLFWLIPREWARRPADVIEFARVLFLTWPRDWLNHWENLYGAGIAVVWCARFRRERVHHIHAVWASLPAMAAWTLARLTDTPFSVGAHAYDLFDHGGDWLLRGKCRDAAFVHTSTLAGRRRLLELGVPPERIVLARRGLDQMPPCRPLRESRAPLRLICIARLVAKKGLLRQIALYRALRDSGFAFTVRLVGDGPLRPEIRRAIQAGRLENVVTLVGELPQPEVWAELARADALVHTGVVTDSGDRDGLPNVVPEAMAAGVIVVSAPGEGVEEAVAHERTGFVCALEDAAAWLATLRRIQAESGLIDAIRLRARRWVEENFDAVANAALILDRIRAAASAPAVHARLEAAAPPESPCCSST